MAKLDGEQKPRRTRKKARTTGIKRKQVVRWADSPPESPTRLLAELDRQTVSHMYQGDKPTMANKEQFTEAQIMAQAQLARERLEEGRVVRAGGKFSRRPSEFRATRYISSIRLDIVTAEIMKLHAFIRRVGMATLIADILGVWIERATNYEQAIFRECLPPGMRAALVPERFVGYHRSLGYIPPMGTEVPEPPKATVPPPAPVEAAAVEDPEPPELPPPPPEVFTEAETPLKVEVPTMAVAHDVGTDQDIIAEPVIPAAAPPGWGSAAAAYGMGYDPGMNSVSDLVERQADARVKQLREEAEAARKEHRIVPEEMFGVRRDGSP